LYDIYLVARFITLRNTDVVRLITLYNSDDVRLITLYNIDVVRLITLYNSDVRFIALYDSDVVRLITRYNIDISAKFSRCYFIRFGPCKTLILLDLISITGPARRTIFCQFVTINSLYMFLALIC
jgi:hypothetical protein